jgi:hypothetical protein
VRHKITLFAAAGFVSRYQIALVALLNQGERWSATHAVCSGQVRAPQLCSSAGVATVRAITLGVRALKNPCDIHLVAADHKLVLSASADRSLRDPEATEAWSEFDHAVALGGHTLASGQGNPDHLVMQAAGAATNALVHNSRPAAVLVEELLRVAPALLKAEEATAASEFFALQLNVAAHGRNSWLSPTGELEPFIADPRAGRGCDMVAPDQLAMIRRLGRTHQLDVEEECREALRCDTGSLTTYAASWFIAYLRKRGVDLKTNANDHAATAAA